MDEIMNNVDIEVTATESDNEKGNFNLKDFAMGAAAGVAGAGAIYGIVKAVRRLIVSHRTKRTAEELVNKNFDKIVDIIDRKIDDTFEDDND